jgi:hypothetical protein
VLIIADENICVLCIGIFRAGYVQRAGYDRVTLYVQPFHMFLGAFE